MERAELIRKVQLLLNGAAGRKAIGSMHEAEAFAAKAQQLLVEHGLSMTEVEVAAQAQDDPFGEVKTEPRRNGAQIYRTVPEWQKTLADAITFSYGGCVMTMYGTSSLIFVGRESTRPVMVYVYEQLLDAARRLMRTARKAYNKEQGYIDPGFEGSYMVGFSKAIQERLVAERKAMEDRVHAAAKAERKEQQAGAALVRINKDPALAREWAEQKHFPKLSPEEQARIDQERQARIRRIAAAQVEADRADRKMLAALTPAQREKELARRAKKEERQQAKEQREDERYWDQQHRQNRRNEQLHGNTTAQSRGYQDGRSIAITKGVKGASGPAPKQVS